MSKYIRTKYYNNELELYWDSCRNEILVITREPARDPENKTIQEKFLRENIQGKFKLNQIKDFVNNLTIGA